MKKLFRSCPVCKCLNGNILYHVSMSLPEGINLPTNYDVVSCESCGFTFADVNITQDAYNYYYKHSNIYNQNTILKAVYDLEIQEQRYSFIEQHLSRNSKIIDLGCGHGTLLLTLQKHNYQNITGLDPSDEAIQFIKSKGIDGHIGNIFDAVSVNLEGKYDAVICTAVIEHIYDLNSFVEQCKKYLRKGGLVFIDAPAVEGFERYIREIPNYFNHEHINYFSQQSLDNLFLKHGLRRFSPYNEGLVTVQQANWQEEEIFAIYKDDVSSVNPAFIKDDLSERSIKKYLKLVHTKMEIRKSKLMSFINQYDKVILWGTGSLAMQIIEANELLLNKIKYFVDNNKIKQNMTIRGFHICSPERLLKENECIPVVILSMLNAQDIILQIKKMQIKNSYYVF